MTSRNSGFGLAIALSLASVSLTLNTPALAQDEAPPAEDPFLNPPQGEEDAAADAADEAPAAEAADDAPEPDEEAEEEPEPTAEPAGEPEAPAAQAERRQPRAADEQSTETGPEEVTVAGIELLPGSASPSTPVRGIAYGSLWRTFHGLQWPYMRGGEGDRLRIGFSGYIWNDLSNTRIDADSSLSDAAINDQNRWTTQTRGVLRVTPTYNAGGDWFVQGNAEIVVQGDMRPDPSSGVLATTDDLWVRAGMWDVFDVTVGRFQGWEIANHYGMGLDINTLERQGAWIVGASLPRPSDGYGLTYFWDRQNFLLGGYALHVYPTKYLRAEVLGHVGAGSSSNAANPYQMDVRPSVIFDVGFLKLKAGWEYGKAIPQDEKQVVRDSKNGYGFAAQFILDPYVELGGSFARGFQDVIDKDDQADLAASNTVQTVGGFLNASPGHEPLVFGFGAFLNSWENFRINREAGAAAGQVDTNDQWLVFGAVQYTFWTRFNMKFVFSHASNKVEDFRAGDYVNNAMSGRLRAEYLF